MSEEKVKRKRRTKQEIEADTKVEAEVKAPEVDSKDEVANEAPPSPNIPSEPVLVVKVQGQKVEVLEYDETLDDGVVVSTKIKGKDGCTYTGTKIVRSVLL